VTRLMWYLWDDPEIFKLFTDKFMVKQCEITPEEYERDPQKLDEFLEMVVHRCFLDLTSQI